MYLFTKKELSEWVRENVSFEEKYDYLARFEKFSVLNESQIENTDSFDIFLSHSYKDRDLVLGIKAVFEKLGYSVYVDWINDRLLSRGNVSKDTASVLQKRMRQSKSLIYVTSENSSQSKWMPWEAGFFDGIRDRMIAILPITDEEQNEKPFIGQEYLGLYPYLALDSLDKDFINKPMFMEPTAFESMLNQYRSIDKLFVFRDYQSYVNGNLKVTPFRLFTAI